MVNLNMVDSVELTEQTDSLAAKQMVLVACISDDPKHGKV